MTAHRLIIVFIVIGATLGVAAAPAAAQMPEPQAPRVNTGGVLLDSFKLLMTEHAIRVGFQEKTQRELGGPFWRDYRRSLRMPRTWEDSDGWLVNYIGHPLHGAAAGFIWLHHDPRSRREEFGLNARYWATRWRAVAWSAGYSLQFEIGPLSEASIGNVGLDPRTTGWVDYVVTPAGAFALLVGEDALDRFFIQWFERVVGNHVARAAMRMLFNPSRTMANLSSNKAPWHRDGRRLRRDAGS